MPTTTDFNAIVHALVSSAVSTALEPYQSALDRLAALLGEGPVRQGSSEPRIIKTAMERRSDQKVMTRPASKVRVVKGSPKATRAPGGVRASRKAEREATHSTSSMVGQIVEYKQGRGSFEARVVAVEARTGFLALERLTDGKKVIRPTAKVSLLDGVDRPSAPKVVAVKPILRRRANAPDALLVLNGARQPSSL